MKKKILIIFTGEMELGGIEKSLLGLLDAISYEEYEVDLFLYGRSGALYPYINSNVNIFPEIKELAYLKKSVKEKLRHGCFYSLWRRLLKSVCKESFCEYWGKVVKKKMKPIQKEYDLALSFAMPFDVLRDFVNAKVKVGWIHTDYSRESCLGVGDLHEIYEGLDYIAGVSEDCCKVFKELLPEYKDKTIVVENISSKELMFKQVEESLDGEMEKGKVKLLSIGRFCTAKNFDNVPEIVSIIKKSGIDVVWYLIGFGMDEELIHQKIKEYHVEDSVIVLGKKENPYPYIKACDIYVQPSRYEGKCVAVREAQMLCKPVIITNYPTSASQLEDGVDGVGVPMDNEGCAKGIMEVINDKELQEKLISNCKARDYSNSQEVEKLYTLIY